MHDVFIQDSVSANKSTHFEYSLYSKRVYCKLDRLTDDVKTETIEAIQGHFTTFFH